MKKIDLAGTEAVRTQAGPPVIPVIRATRWFYFTLVLTQFAVYASLGAAIAVILPASAAAISGSGKVGSLGTITAVAALGALVSQPLVGRLSDRTRLGFGRRKTWVLIGGIVAGVSLFGLSIAKTIPELLIGTLVLQMGVNSVVAMINASLPDRVPVSHRSRVSGALGIAIAVGSTAGIAIAGFIPSHSLAWIILGCIVLVATILFATTNTDVPAPRSLSRPDIKAQRLPRNADFWWAFVSKFAVFMTYQAITGYLFYILTDYVHVAKSNPGTNVSETVSLLSIVSLVALSVVSVVGGILADKVGRLKPFVIWAAIGFAFPGLILFFVPTLTGLIVAQIVSGAAFGLYSVVDQALLTRVLPSELNAAGDLGILNVAGAVPNVAAPVVAGLLISSAGGYHLFFIITSVFAIIGGVTVFFVRKVR